MAKPRYDPRVRLFVNDTWWDVTSYVRHNPPITIRTGRKDRSKTPDPGTCMLTFENEDGAFTPRNPTSPFVGSLNRYTPIAVLLDEMRDTFSRVVASGWSSTDTGETYATKSVGGTILATDYSVDGQHGNHLIPAAASYRMSYLGAASGAKTAYNGEVVVDWTLPFTDVTGGAVEPGNVALRLQSDTQYYLVRVTVETDETLKVRIMKDDTVTLAGPVTVPGVTHAAGQVVWVLGGAYDDTIYANVWVGDLDDRPAGWLLEADDTTYGYGFFGVRTGAASGNTNVPFTCSYGDALFYPSQFNGEVPEWPQEFSDDGVDMVVPIEAGGILRRLSDDDEDMDSTLRRYYTKVSSPLPAYCWPLDGGTESTGGLAAIGPNPLNLFVGADSPPFFAIDPKSVFGHFELSSWLPKGPSLGGLAQLTNQDFEAGNKDLLQVPLTNYFALDFVRAGGLNTKDIASVFFLLGGPSRSFEVTFDHVADTIKFEWYANNVNMVSSSVTASALATNAFDGGPHHYRLDVFDAGASRSWRLFMDGSQINSGTTSATFPTDIHGINLQALLPIDKVPRCCFYAVAIYNDVNAPDVINPYTAMLGHSGEYVDNRLVRILNEEGIRHFIPGFSTVTKVGPQFQETLVGQLDEAMRTDGGLYRELLSARALHFDPRNDMINAPVAVTLDVGAGETAPPYLPVDDDKDLVNVVKANKREGGTYTYEVSSGRLGSQDPKLGGAGRKKRDVHANPYSDSQLPGIAQLEAARGTLDLSRYPRVRVDLTAPEIAGDPALYRAVRNVYVSNRVKLTNMSRWHQVVDADLLVIGVEKELTPYLYRVEWNCAPYAPDEVFVLNQDRLGGESLTTAQLDAGVTGTFQATATGISVWTVDAADFPMDVFVGGLPGVPGERVTLSGISGAGPTQTFTVTARGVNGFTKTWPAGTSVRPVVTAVLG